MTMNMTNKSRPDNTNFTQDEIGEWYVATRLLTQTPMEELGIPLKTGATVLSSRRGFWNDALNTYDIELYLWGRPDQLALAQETFKLKSSQDAALDRPEQYWG